MMFFVVATQLDSYNQTYLQSPISGDSCRGEGQSGQVSVVSLCAQTCNFALLRKVSTFSQGGCCGARVGAGLGPQNW